MAERLRKRLDDILSGGGADFDDLWTATEPATDRAPLPGGRYRCLVAGGELAESKAKGTPSYKLTFEVIEPVEHAGRKVWHDLWLTAKALAMTKRDLAKLGIVAAGELERPPAPGIVVDVRVALRVDDDGVEYNRVAGFEVIDQGAPRGALDPDPAELGEDTGEADTRDAGGFDWATGKQGEKPNR